MVNPIATFRWFFEVAGRRPKLVRLIGLGLMVEAGRVWVGLDAGEPVTLLGHGGFETLDPAEDAAALVSYAYWVGFCGVLLWVLTGFARRAAKAAAVGAPSPAQAVPTGAGRPAARIASRAGPPARSAPPVVQRMRHPPTIRR